MEEVFVIEFTEYEPNDEYTHLHHDFFTTREQAVDFLESDGFVLEYIDTFKKGSLFGSRAAIKCLELHR